ALPNLFLNALN
ncbi:unnamed protein product, partial [Allacma fusca]